jgi:hypothetical protein
MVPAMRGLKAGAAAVGAVLALCSPASAQLPGLPGVPGLPGGGGQSPVQPYGTNDGGGFWNILPPGSGGHANAVDLAAFLAACPPGGTTDCPGAPRPKHSSRELGMYGDLVYASPGLQAGDISKYFKDATFGVRDGEAERTYSPRPDVTIVRDSGFGVPHVYGTTRAGAMFGLGYVSAEDRLWQMDVFRHAARGTLSEFVGAGENDAFLQMDIVTRREGYTEAEIQQMFDTLDDKFGSLGTQVQEGLTAYTDGVNAYIDELKTSEKISDRPVEYEATGNPFPTHPEPWTEADTLFLVAKGPNRGKPLTPAGLRTVFRYHRAKTGVPAGHPHALRHSFGTALAEAGVDLAVLQALMGHDHVDSAAEDESEAGAALAVEEGASLRKRKRVDIAEVVMDHARATGHEGVEHVLGPRRDHTE